MADSEDSEPVCSTLSGRTGSEWVVGEEEREAGQDVTLTLSPSTHSEEKYLKPVPESRTLD